MKNDRIDKIILPVLVIVVAGYLLAGCASEDTNNLHVATQWKGNDTVPMGGWDSASYGYWYVRNTVLNTISGFFWSAVLVGHPLAIIVGVTGWQFGKKEMPVEGLLIAVLGVLLMAVGPYREMGLLGWVLALNVVPGLMLVFWRSEGGKVMMFLGLDLIFAVALVLRCFDLNPWRVGIIVALVLVKVLVLSALLGDDDKKHATAAAHH